MGVIYSTKPPEIRFYLKGAYKMTKKRFIFHKCDGEIEDTETQEFHEVDKYHFDYMIVEKMNSLSDENKELKNEIHDWKTLVRTLLKEWDGQLND